MRTIKPPPLPPTGVHAALDALVQPLAELYGEAANLTDRASEIEQDLADEAVQADIAAARAASLGKATPPTSKRAHGLIADQLEVGAALAVVASALASATSDLAAALSSHGRTWADEVERTALARRTEVLLDRIDDLAAADLGVQAARGLVAHLRDGAPLQPVGHGRAWSLMRPSGEPLLMGEVLTGLRRCASEQPPGPPGRLRFAGSRTA